MRIGGLFALVLLLTTFATNARAEEHVVEMLNRGEEGLFVFSPALLLIEPGDTVRFVPTDRGHNAETIDGMIPDGAEPFTSRVNEEFTVTFDVEGVYGYRCRPHYALGHVGLIVVGDPDVNLEAAAAVDHPGNQARTRLAEMFDRLRQGG